MRQRTDCRAGFALIEVLAALVITAALVAVALPFATNLLKRWGTGEPDIEAADSWMQAIERLSDDVAEAVPITLVASGQRAVAFRADAKLLKLVRPALGETAKVGLEIVTYSIDSKPDGDALVRHARPFAEDAFDDERAEASEITILEGAFRLKFTITGTAGTSDGGGHALKKMPEGAELTAYGLGRARVPPGPIILPIVARGETKQPTSPEHKNQP